MNIREFSKPVTSKTLNESLAKRFGTKIDVDQFTTEQLQDARNKIRTTLSQVETTESFDKVQTSEHSKNKLFLDVLNAALSERDDVTVAIDEAIETLSEGEEDKAELVMAAKDMVDRVTGWMEDTAEMQTESMLELADAIRDEMGSEQSEAFTASVKPALEAMYGVMETTRATLTNGVGMLTGEAEPMDTMGDDDMDMDDMEPTDDMDAPADDMDMDDDFGAADASAGGEEEAGREKRESVDHSKKKVNEGVDSDYIYRLLRQQKAAGVAALSMIKLDKFMQNQGRGSFDYETFKAAYDSDPRLQELVTNFDKDKIEFKQSEVDDVAGAVPGNPGRPSDTVGKMAKNAVDLTDL